MTINHKPHFSASGLTKLSLFILLCFINTSSLAGTQGNWSSIPIFNQAPLEVKIGTFSESANPDLLVMVLWNDGSNNRLTAMRVPHPYDGNNISETDLEDTQTLFALGDICTDGNQVVVPYIKSFNVELAEFNGVSWSTRTLPETIANNFDNADCGMTMDGTFILTHDLTDTETVIYKSSGLNNNKSTQGGDYTFYDRYSSLGPFDGGTREPLATSWGARYLSTIYQQTDGDVHVAWSDTSVNPPVISHFPVIDLPTPTGFTFVKESAAAFNGHGITFTYNADGKGRLVDVPASNPMNLSQNSLGQVSNNGSQFTFQGAAMVSVRDKNGLAIENNVLWGDYFLVDFDPLGGPIQVEEDSNYPLTGVGGPIDGCAARNFDFQLTGFFAGPRAGSDGTNIYLRELNGEEIFADGFESGDTSNWTFACVD